MLHLFHDIEFRANGRPTRKVDSVLDDELPRLARSARRRRETITILKSGLYREGAETTVLEVGLFYKTNQEAWPLLRITNSFKLHGQEGDDDMRIVEVDLIDGDGLPVPACLTAQDLKRYNPRPATEDDFEDLDLDPPTYAFRPDLTAQPEE